jgi:hypothetical protein
MSGRSYAATHPLQTPRAKINDDQTRKLAAEGRQKSAEAKDKKRQEAVRDFCLSCIKVCNNSCSFFQYKGQGIPSIKAIVEICYACMTDKNVGVEYCQSWSCPIRPYHVKKSRGRLVKEMNDLMGG